MAYKPKMSESKIEKLDKMPLIQQRIFKSRNGKYMIHQLRISSIRPTAYYEKVLESEPEGEIDLF